MTTKTPGAELPMFPQLREEPMKPPPAYEQWREEAAVKRVAMHSDQRVWVVLRHAEARQALSHPDLSADTSNPHFPRVRKGATATSKNTMLRQMDPPLHGKYRRMMASQFTLKRVNELRPELERIVDDAIDDLLSTGGPADLHATVSLVIPTKVICALLGVDYSLSPEIQRASGVITSAAASAQEFNAAAATLHGILDAEITAQEAHPKEGLIGKLITDYMSRGDIDREQIRGQMFMTIVAGHETTANTISMGMMQLFERPDLYARVRNDFSLLPGLIEDMIRMHALADGVPARVATADLVIGGQEIKAGEGVITVISAPNFDPRVWENPYQLDPERDSRNHISFSVGIHSCLGQNLARAELELTFQRLFTRIPTLRLADVADPIEMVNDGYVYGARRLMVEW